MTLIDRALVKAATTKDWSQVNSVVNSLNMLDSCYNLSDEEKSSTKERLESILTEYLFHGDISLARIHNPPPSTR